MGAGAQSGRVRRCCAGGGLRAADRGRGKVAGLPECEELFEAGEDARENGGDQGVQGRRQAGACLLPQGAGLGGGDLGAAGGMA